MSLDSDPSRPRRALEFYGELRGLEEGDVPPRLDPRSFVWFRAGHGLELHLMLGGKAASRDRRHFCLAVDDLEELRARLGAGGYETSDPTPIVGRRRFFCRDLFGHLVGLTRIES